MSNEEYTIIRSGTDLIQQLPTGDKFNIAMLSTWDELTQVQQSYVQHYLASGLQKTLAAYHASVSPSHVYEMRKKSTAFETAIKEIESIFVEGLRSVHIMDSFSNSKIRKGTLQALGAEGFESAGNTPKVQNNLIVDSEGGLRDIINTLKENKL